MELQIADNLKVILKHFKINQEDFGEMTGTSQKTISNYCTRVSTPDLDMIFLLKKMTSISVDTLLFGKVRSIDLPDRLYGQSNNIEGEKGEPIKMLIDTSRLEERLSLLEYEVSKLKNKQ